MIETWKDINGYEGSYQVSNNGRIKKLKCFFNREEKILKNQNAVHGYLFIGLRKNKKREFILIHRLVAMHFVSKPIGHEYVNHKDGDKFNNSASNLEWVTASQNTIHAYANGLIKGKKLKHEATN